MYVGGGSGWGLAPAHGFVILHMTMLLYLHTGVVLQWNGALVTWFMHMTIPSMKWHAGFMLSMVSPRLYGVTCDHNRSTKGEVGTVSNSLALSLIERCHMTLMCLGARRLGADVPITVLQFAPLARLHPVLGFHALNCMCARFMKQGCIL
jgi:hypothetical protein